MSMAQMSCLLSPPHLLSLLFANPYGYIPACYPKYAHGSGFKGQESPQRNAHAWMDVLRNSLIEYAHGDFSQINSSD